MTRSCGRRRVCVTLGSSIIAACTVLCTHLCCERPFVTFLAVGKEVELNPLLGLDEVDSYWAPAALLQDPESATFLRLAADRTRSYVGDHDRRYQVWTIPFAGRSVRRGWPFVTEEPQTTVYIELLENADGLTTSSLLASFELTVDGRPPTRVLELAMNWLCFFGIATPVILMSLWCGHKLRLRFSSARRGFPVLTVAKEENPP